ncbi:hypothetical protein RJ41_01570 [Alteromonas marina]|uniref:Uncharacterized protein n=1 Tax=Alteromonas marina TaxID=203795 RepID=A0A0B3Y6E7_9ALTE|nr:hypothetical protein RJ41_01570 [Alteromonas marina]
MLLLLPLKLFAMPLKEGVKPHQKLSAAGTLLRSRHGWLHGVFLMGLHSRPKIAGIKKAHLSANADQLRI